MLPPYGLCLPCTDTYVDCRGTIAVKSGDLWIKVELDIPEDFAPGAIAWLRTTLSNGTALSVVISDIAEVARMLQGERKVRGEIYVGTEDKLSDLLRHAGLTVAPDSAGLG
jgi:hypothetical protein